LTNILQLNIGVVLFYLLTADWWLTAMRLLVKRKRSIAYG
jgi:hypothetical protein